MIETSWMGRRIGAAPTRDLMTVALLLRLVMAERQQTALLLLSPQFRSQVYRSQEAARQEIAAVAAIPGDVACTNKVVCRAAGKPFVVDEFKMEELVATGRATNADVAALLKSRGITVFINIFRSSESWDTSLRQVLRQP
jgi:hypothetical protein